MSASDPVLATRLAQLTLELVQIPSETTFEAAIAEDLERRCRQLVGDSVIRVGNSVIAWTPKRPDRPVLGFFGHSDTVKAASDQPYEIKDGRVYGCGASDMKGSLAVMLLMLEEWEEAQLAQGIFVFYDKEEGPMAESGMPAVLDRLKQEGLFEMDLALCLEPTDGECQVGCIGSNHILAKVKGKRAHSARPWHGTSAVTQAIPLLTYLGEREPWRVDISGFIFADVMTVTAAETFNSRNVVPDVLELNINHRFHPGVSSEQAYAAALKELAPFKDVVDFTLVDSAPSGRVEAEHPLLAEWTQRFGIKIRPKQAWTDVARLSIEGIPAANYGPGATAQAHQAGEWIEIDALVEAYHALRALLIPADG